MVSPLLRAVLDAPDDEDVRRVYADWLLEQGDPRGELIHIQCDLGAEVIGANGRRPWKDLLPADLVKREGQLLRKHAKTWLAPIRPFIQTWSWSRGFIDGVTANAGKFLDGIDTIFETTPLASVNLAARRAGHLERLAASKHAPKLRSIVIPWSKLEPDDVRQLHALTGLRALDLSGNPLGVDGCAALGRSTAPIERLSLASCLVSADALSYVSFGTFFRKLTHLDLAGNPLHSGGATNIFMTAESLRDLDLSHAQIGDDGLAVLARLPALKNLERLQLAGNDIGEHGARALIESPHLSNLRVVQGLRFTRDTPVGALLYARSPHWVSY